MICRTCRNAAVLAVVHKETPPRSPHHAASRANNVKALHAACRGGSWCDCQHMTQGTK